jgi:hypothetical protein
VESVCATDVSCEERVKSSSKSIFRPEAVRRYEQRGAVPVFPKSVIPRAFILLWAALALLAGLALLVFCSPVPIYARGVAALASPDTFGQSSRLLVVLIPDDQASRLRIGQRVLFRTAMPVSTETARIVFIYPGTLTPQQIQALSDNTASCALTMAGSKAVALAELDPASANEYARSGFPGGCEALVEVGSLRVLTLIRWQSPQ